MSAHLLVEGKKTAQTTCIYCSLFFFELRVLPRIFDVWENDALFFRPFGDAQDWRFTFFKLFSECPPKLAINERKGVI